MALDQERIRFRGKAFKVAIDLNASLGDDEAVPFLEKLYQEFQARPSPVPAEDWLRDRLANTFISMNATPHWVEDEPIWPFFEGAPMVFIMQSTVPDNEVSRAFLSPCETIYLFGVRQEIGRGFKMIYRTVSQFGDLSS